MNDINNLISEELSKMSQLFHHQRGRVISEQPAKDVTDLKTYPACVQNLRSIKISQSKTGSEVFAIQTSGDFENYRFYNNGTYGGPNNKRGKYSCSGNDILIDGNKLTTTTTTYPKCVTNKGWGDPVTTAKGQTYIKGGPLAYGEVDFTGYYFYNNGKVLTPKKVVQSYKCSADNNIISVFATPAKAPAAAAPKADEAAKIKNITSAWCREKDGIINWEGSAVDKMKWADYLTKYSVTEPQLTQAKTTAQTACPNKSSTTVVNNKVSDTPKVKRGNTQNLSTLTQDVQKSIGGTPSGKFSSQELDSILQRLGGNDVKSEVSQETQTTQSFPTDASGKPDLDKILASLS
jgi:hypothetical protein